MYLPMFQGVTSTASAATRESTYPLLNSAHDSILAQTVKFLAPLLSLFFLRYQAKVAGDEE